MLWLVAVTVSSWLLGGAVLPVPPKNRVSSCAEVRPTPPRTPSKAFQAPVPVKRVTPVHPTHLRQTEGVVVLEVVVSEKGRVESVCVAQSLSPELDLEAARAVRQWRFTPTRIAGRPVKVTTSVSMTFRKNRQ